MLNPKLQKFNFKNYIIMENQGECKSSQVPKREVIIENVLAINEKISGLIGIAADSADRIFGSEPPGEELESPSMGSGFIRDTGEIMVRTNNLLSRLEDQIRRIYSEF